MKISIDGILGSARKIKSQKPFDEDNLSNKKKDIKTDSVNITRKVDSRLDKIDSEFRDIQSSLTKNQIIKNGIDQLNSDMMKGGSNSGKILDQVTFEGKQVLKSYMTGNINPPLVENKYLDINKSIDTDISKLKKLQVEVDNIMASNLAGDGKVENIMSGINSLFGNIEAGKMDNYSNLKVDSVMKLIK